MQNEDKRGAADLRPAPASIPIACGFAALLFAANLAGAMTPAASRLLAVLALGTTAIWAHRTGARPAWLLAALPFAPLATAKLGHDAGEALSIASVVAVLLVIARLTREREPHATIARRVANSAAITAALLIAVQHSAIAWRAADALATGVSFVAGAIAGAPLQYGPTIVGVWVALLFLLLALPTRASRLDGGWRVVAIYAAVVAAVLTMHALLLPRLERALVAVVNAIVVTPAPHHAFSVSPSQLAPTLVLVPLLLLTPFAARLLLRTTPREAAAPRPRLLYAAAAIAIAGALLASLPQRLTPLRDRPTIVFRDDGTLDWSKPVPQRYSLIQAGMFGQLREYLEAAGYRTRVARAPLTTNDLAGARAIVIINPQKSIPTAERTALWSWVERGGGLLVAGDHTDIFGIRAHLDELLAPVGVNFEFDSAFALRRHWRFSQSFHSHASTVSLRDHRDTQIGTGGSLTLRGFESRPIVTGRYGFSDLGNRANAGRGAFLGDYRHQTGERLGDVVLVSSAHRGRGRVIVFGDTTSFQPLALPWSYPFVERTFRHLATPSASRVPLMLGIALLAIGFALIAFARPSSGAIPTLAAIGVLGAAIGSIGPPSPAAPLPEERLAAIDATHVPRLSPESFEPGSMFGGIAAALERANYLPVVARDEATLERASLTLFVTPARTPSEELAARLAKRVEAGATLLVTGGVPHTGAANGLLAQCGMSIGNVPLGAAEGKGRDDATLTFVDAWPVQAPGDATRWARTATADVIAETRAGRGRCIAIGDPRFFDEKNFEGEYEFQRAAVELIDRMLREGRS